MMRETKVFVEATGRYDNRDRISNSRRIININRKNDDDKFDKYDDNARRQRRPGGGGRFYSSFPSPESALGVDGVVVEEVGRLSGGLTYRADRKSVV